MLSEPARAVEVEHGAGEEEGPGPERGGEGARGRGVAELELVVGAADDAEAGLRAWR